MRYHLLHSSLSGPDLYYDVGTLITERRDRPDNWIYPSSFGSSNRCEHLSFISSIVRGLGQLPDAESLLRKASRPSPSSGYPQRLPHARVLNGCWRLPENLSENSVLMGVFVKCRGCPPNTPASLVTAYKAITQPSGEDSLPTPRAPAGLPRVSLVLSTKYNHSARQVFNDGNSDSSEQCQL